MAYINSNKIRVFPSVGRSNYDIESQLMNENNISQIVRSLCRNRKSYVLSNQLASNEPFEFVIYGFYFKILNATDTFKAIRNSLKVSGETTDDQINKINIWAGIKLYKNAEGNNESNSYQLLQLANSIAVSNDVHELDTGKPADNPETSVFQGVVFDRTEDKVRTALKTAEGVVDGDVYVLQLLGENTSVPVQSLLHLNTTEILNIENSNETADSISNKFTTKKLDVSQSISDAGTLTVTGATTLNTLVTSSNTSIGGTLTVSGATTLNTLATGSNASISGTLNVEGATTLASVTASNTTISGTLTVTGETILNNNLTVSGAATINQEKVEFSKPTTITNSLTVSNNNLNINNGKIAFSPFNSSDSSPLIYSEVASENTNLVFALSDDTTDSFIFRTNTHDLGEGNPDTFTINRSGLSSLVNITAPTFVGNLSGNFTTSRTFTFSGGDISGSTSSNSGNYTITASIRNGAVTEAKIADNAVTTNKIKNDTITTPKIEDAAITNSKIANEAVTTDKLANEAVITNKIKDLNVTTSKIDNSAVTNDKIANETIKVEKLGFNLNMVLKVDGDDNEHQILTINLPTLENK